MDIEQIFALIDKAEASLFDRIEIQTQDLKLCLQRNTQAPLQSAGQAETSAVKEESKVGQTPDIPDEDVVFTPISGVFYARKDPEAEPYVSMGMRVNKGQPLCIIEAMKTMNEICAPKSGVISRIFKADSENVGAGDALFAFERVG